MARTHLMPPALRDAFRTFVFSLIDRPAVIAGGFAAEWTQAGDVDLFVFGDPQLSATCAHLTAIGAAWDGEITHPYTNGNRSVIELDSPLLPIQIIGCEETSWHRLLDTFDISTHRWAVTRDGVHLRGTDATTVFEAGRVLLPNEGTPARVKRLEDRYQIEIAPYVAPPTTKTASSKKGPKAA